MLLQWCACCLSRFSLFQSCGAFFWGEGVGFGFLVCVAVYDAGGAWSAFCPLARVVSGFGLFSSMVFDGHMWGFRGGGLGFFLLWVVFTTVLACTKGTRTSQLFGFQNFICYTTWVNNVRQSVAFQKA